MTRPVPYANKIDFGFPRPWGGGNEDARSIRIYYGTHASLVPACPKLTRKDIAWVMIDMHEPPEEYNWNFAVGHDMWLWPCGFSTAPYGRRLKDALAANHVHRVMKVQGFDEDTLALVQADDLEVVTAGPVKGMYRHEMLPAGTV